MEDNLSTLNISVVVPLFNEEESIKELFLWIKRVMDEHQFTYEVLFINDGSTDRSWTVLPSLKNYIPHIPKQKVLSLGGTMENLQPCIAVSSEP